MNTMVSFRIDKKVKEEASQLFDSLGMNLSTAINIFLRQSIIKKKFPIDIEYEISKDYSSTYPQKFTELFGTGNNLGFDEEPKEIPFKYDVKREKVWNII